MKSDCELIAKKKNIDVIILDDAYQHRWVNPGLSILLTDYNRLFTRDHLLPYGRLREQKYNRRRADIIIVSKTASSAEDFVVDIKNEIDS